MKAVFSSQEGTQITFFYHVQRDTHMFGLFWKLYSYLNRRAQTTGTPELHLHQILMLNCIVNKFFI